uniref:CARD domain-containing protein n=1 Tax=Peromyscus maniculatus bairdii TaxID=230844 RepID=A0A8C8W4T2_PERMB
MADNILRAKRKQFICSVGAETINGLLDELLEKKVLNQGEMERIKAVNATVMDKARDLCDSVIKKGPLACQIFITYICNEDVYLAGRDRTSHSYLTLPFPQLVLFPQTGSFCVLIPMALT